MFCVCYNKGFMSAACRKINVSIDPKQAVVPHHCGLCHGPASIAGLHCDLGVLVTVRSPLLSRWPRPSMCSAVSVSQRISFSIAAHSSCHECGRHSSRNWGLLKKPPKLLDGPLSPTIGFRVVAQGRAESSIQELGSFLRAYCQSQKHD